MLLILLFLAVCFLAYSNGANDNFKGVATLFGSDTIGYKTAIGWATVATLAGSIYSIYLAAGILQAFSGKGLVPDHIVGGELFLLAVAVGAGATVILATLIGIPISTTHSLVGAIVGSGLMAAGSQVDHGQLLSTFFMPLLVSPLLALLLGAIFYLCMRRLRVQLGISKEWCVCVGNQEHLVPIAQPTSVLAVDAARPGLSFAVDTEARCDQRYRGRFLGVNCQRLIDAAHFLSAGAVSFARGLNDTPKITALLLVIQSIDMRWGVVAVAVAMGLGGLLSARKVADTMGHRITAMNHGQGFSANLTTSLLVIGASTLGVPVSTTHVSVGSLFGIGLVTREAHFRMIGSILLSWFVTLPCAAASAALAYWLTLKVS